MRIALTLLHLFEKLTMTWVMFFHASQDYFADVLLARMLHRNSKELVYSESSESRDRASASVSPAQVKAGKMLAPQ
ncbi:hypothetical protein IQ250_19595 [Pseudanabaenaceae cyanobacterium LEGE 13415]|nr:hypothetical protein [Pseudanabaenaceae cyanobacterium LEGE 13415]